MKKLFSLIFVLFLACSSHASFDTQDGQYLSEQDLIYTLQTIFFKTDLLNWSDNYQLQYFNYVNPTFTQQKFFEFGFINLETGEKMTHAPDSTYILSLDLFISKVLSELMIRHDQQFVKKVFSANSNEFIKTKMQGYPGTLESWCKSTSFSTLPLDIQMQMIEDIAVFIYEDRSLVPPQLLLQTQNTVTQAAVAKNLSTYLSIVTVFKKIIISDQFLKY